jgi:hypothetical protein
VSRLSRKCGNFNVSQTSGLPRPVTEISLHGIKPKKVLEYYVILTKILGDVNIVIWSEPQTEMCCEFGLLSFEEKHT